MKRLEWSEEATFAGRFGCRSWGTVGARPAALVVTTSAALIRSPYCSGHDSPLLHRRLFRGPTSHDLRPQTSLNIADKSDLGWLGYVHVGTRLASNIDAGRSRARPIAANGVYAAFVMPAPLETAEYFEHSYSRSVDDAVTSLCQEIS